MTTTFEEEVQTMDILDKVDEVYQRMIEETYKVALSLVLGGYEADEALREALRQRGW